MQPMEIGGQQQQSQQPSSQRGTSSYKVEPQNYHSALNGPVGGQIRADFIRKVYGILAMQMAVTVGISAFAMYTPFGDIFVPFATGWGPLIMLIPTIGILCALQAKKNQHPLNYQLLLAFTVCMSMNIAGICTIYQKAGAGILILEAFAITMTAFSGLSMYALKSGQNFEWMGGMLSMGLCSMMMFSFFGMIFGFSGGIFYPICGCLLFCGYILYDTSRILNIYGPDDAIMASIELYLDILNLFLYVLEILNSRSD